MAVIQPSSFAQLMARAPNLNEQGGAFAQIPVFNATVAAKMVGDTLAAKTDLEGLRIQGENLLKVAKEQRKPASSTLGDRLRAIAPALMTMGQSGGVFGGGNRFAGDMLSSLLQDGSITPNQLLGDFNTTLGGLNLARSQMEPWSASTRRAAQGGIALN
jgi:hypothetical protein